MIEACGFPLLGTMTTVAGFAKTPTVYIVNRMATTAIAGRIFVVGAAMTLCARRFFMRTGQCKMRLAVIERGFAPHHLGMTSLTFVALAALVYIVIAMAVDTLAGRLPQWLVIGMALVACQRNMTALERKIGEVVYKGIAVELQNIGVLTLVLGMAQLALRGFYARLAAMKAGTGIDICGHRFVTRKTQVVQLLATFTCMALGTVTFKFRVRLRQLAR